MEYNKQLDKENVKLFKRYDIWDRSDEYIYHCVLCGKPTCVDSGYSAQGHKFICPKCLTTKFKGFKEARDWQKGED